MARRSSPRGDVGHVDNLGPGTGTAKYNRYSDEHSFYFVGIRHGSPTVNQSLLLES